MANGIIKATGISKVLISGESETWYAFRPLKRKIKISSSEENEKNEG